MEAAVPAPVDQAPSYRRYPVCLFLLLVLTAWHGWMTLSLFGRESPWERLTSAEPVLSGKHAANLYLGLLAANARLATGSGCCYDPSFQAGYPRTPVFEGSRLSEVFLLAAGGDYQADAYKIG